MKKLFLCQEGSSKFYMEAKDLKQAQSYAVQYNAIVIRQVKQKTNL